MGRSSDAPNLVQVLTAAVAESHREAFQCAERLRYLLTVGDETLSDDEITYLALHISRLMQSAREEV